ncbi:hypothetical protein [Streptomyces sp. NPDC059076]|uniref:hypothetical protein n=1 Tax=unclassified Streptomyces TaxID=2593676 RepID=UPI0036C4A822
METARARSLPHFSLHGFASPSKIDGFPASAATRWKRAVAMAAAASRCALGRPWCSGAFDDRSMA